MRTITELYSLEGHVYLFFSSSQTYKHFYETARKEGFALPAGEDDVLALHPDFSFCHTGWAGHLLFHNLVSFDEEKLVRVDYSKWISGSDNYIYHGDRKQGAETV